MKGTRVSIESMEDGILYLEYMKGVPRGIKQQEGVLAENESQLRRTVS
jgi:hypothetical protein